MVGLTHHILSRGFVPWNVAFTEPGFGPMATQENSPAIQLPSLRRGTVELDEGFVYEIPKVQLAPISMRFKKNRQLPVDSALQEHGSSRRTMWRIEHQTRGPQEQRHAFLILQVSVPSSVFCLAGRDLARIEKHFLFKLQA